MRRARFSVEFSYFVYPPSSPISRDNIEKVVFLCVKVSVGPKKLLTFPIRMLAATLYEKELGITN
jgi:hypothetical protein